MNCEEIELLESAIQHASPLAVLLTIELYDTQTVFDAEYAVA
jgi:hypothetical protein